MPASRLLISERAQLRTLASPARQELLDLLVRSGPASAATLGRLAGRPADGLYYHLRELERVGLIRAVGPADGSGRKGAVYRAVHREPAIGHRAERGGNSRDVVAIVSSMLRLGIRDFRRAAALPGVRTDEPGRELWALRVAGRLSPADVRDVNRRMHGLRSAMGRPGARGKLYAITILLAPLEHRTRKKQRRPRRKRS